MSNASRGAAAVEDRDKPRPSSFAPYAQLVKMLLPRSSSFSVYSADGRLRWSSDGYENPDLRELANRLPDLTRSTPTRCSIKATRSGMHAVVAALASGDRNLGYLIVELRQSKDVWSDAVVEGLLSPVLRCLESRLELERPAEQPSVVVSNDALELLLNVDDDTGDASPLQRLVQDAVQHMRCSAGALVMTEKNLQVCCASRRYHADATTEILNRTQKNLLAWAQLNNRPMLVNQFTTHAGKLPHKILSCPVRMDENNVSGVLALFRDTDDKDFDIRDVRIAEFTAQRAVSILKSRHDPLTGLVNRLVFENCVKRSLESNEDDNRYTLLYFDIDRLSAINEAFGYHAGDEVIQRLAEMISKPLRATELASRLGGDRFAVLLSGRSQRESENLARRIVENMSQLRYLDGEESLRVSISAGIAELGRGAHSLPHDFARAELACKQAKELGPPRVCVHGEGGAEEPPRNEGVLTAVALRQALQDNDFVLEAQPIVGLSLNSGEIMGHEIFVRMRSFDGGLLAPDKFLDAARHYGLMAELDRWVVSATIRTLRDAGRAYSTAHGHFVINLSMQSLLHDGFADFILDELLRARLPAQAFRFELAEVAAAAHLREAERFMRALQAGGCSVGLDDFGAGLSSFADLKHMPVHFLKIDGALIRRILIDKYAESLVTGIARAAETLGIYTVAEHVETGDIAERLRMLDINFGQGYHFGRPRALEDVVCRP